MKWIGQHIWSFISRFRNDVYFEDLSTTTETNILVSDSDGKVSKRTASGLTSGKVTVTDSTANTEFPVVFHDESDGLLDDTGSFTYNPSYQTLTMISGVSNLPGILLKNTNTDNKPPQIRFLKDAGEAGADGDYVGSLLFNGDNSAQEETAFGRIRSKIVTALDTDEASELDLQTATSNGLASNLRNVMKGVGHATNETVDVDLGYGAASTTTVAGNLTVTSDLTVSGGDIMGPTDSDLTIKSDTDIILDSDTDADGGHTYVRLKAGGTERFQFHTGRGAQTITSELESYPQLNLTNTSDDGNGGEFVFYKNRTDSSIQDGEDGDVIGKIIFNSYDDGTPTSQTYAWMSAQIADATSGQEAGKLLFYVAEYDGTSVTAGLTIDGDTNANGEIDVTIGAGVGSTTTIAGNTSFASYVVITNGSATGQTALTIDNDDVDQIALSIDAENTTANVVNIDAGPLTTGKALYIDSNSYTDGTFIHVDVDDANTGDSQKTLMGIDYDKSGVTGSGNNNNTVGLSIDLQDSATNHASGSTSTKGLYINVDADNAAGTIYGSGIDVNVFADGVGDLSVTNTFGIRTRVIDGAPDIVCRSHADTGDYFSIATTTHGATTFTTVDDDATAADLTFDVDGEIVLDTHTGEDIFFKENGTERIQWHLDSTPIMEVTGNFDINGSGDINMDTDTGHFNISADQDKMSCWDLNTSSTKPMVLSHGPDSSGVVTIQATTRTGDNAGKNLRIRGGPASASGSNKKGGNLTLQAGDGRGTNSSGEIYFQVREDGSTFGASGTDEIAVEDAFKMGFETSGTVRNVFTVFEPGQDSDEYCRITVADAGVSAIETYDDTGSNGANLTLDIDGDISLDAHTAKDIYFKENGTERFQFHLDSTPTMEVTGNFDIEPSGTLDLKSGINQINKIYDFNATTFENDYSDDVGSGTILRYSPGADESPAGSELFFLHTDGTWNQTDADAVATGASQLLGVGLGASARTTGVLLKGFVRINSTEILNVPGSGAVDGLPVYISTTAGHFDFTAPSGSGDFVRIVGYAIDDYLGRVLIYFDPDKSWVEIA